MPTDPIVILYQEDLDYYINQLVAKVVHLSADYPRSVNEFTGYVMARIKDEFRAQLVDNEFS